MEIHAYDDANGIVDLLTRVCLFYRGRQPAGM